MASGGRIGKAETWLHIRGFEHSYVVSSLGKVRNWSTGRLLFGERDRDGYRRVNLVTADGKYVKRRVHRLVCEAFHGACPEGLECGHLDGQKLNNRADNLAWITRSENGRHKALHGYRYPGQFNATRRLGSDNPSAKLTPQQVLEIRQKAAAGQSGRSLAREYGVGSGNMSRLIRGDSYAMEADNA